MLVGDLVLDRKWAQRSCRPNEMGISDICHWVCGLLWAEGCGVHAPSIANISEPPSSLLRFGMSTVWYYFRYSLQQQAVP